MKFFLIVVTAPIIGSTNTAIRYSGSPKLRVLYDFDMFRRIHYFPYNQLLEKKFGYYIEI